MNYFPPNETTCRCGCGFDITDSFRAKLNALREHMGMPVSLSSAARCQQHNEAEDGAKNSRHMSGDAADISWSGWSPEQKKKALAYALIHFKGVGQCAALLHVDDRPSHAFWFY